MKEQHSSMPINAERQSRVTFGGYEEIISKKNIKLNHRYYKL